MPLTIKEFKNEARYQMLMHQTKRMLKAGVISDEEFLEINARYWLTYKPKIGGILVEKDLLIKHKRVINSAGKEAFENAKNQYP